MTATEDYQAFLRENGLTEESMREGLRAVDTVGLCGECPRVCLGDSKIPTAGDGIFAKEPIEAGSKVAPILKASEYTGIWTLAGRYTNHSHTPNTKAVLNENGVHLVAIQNIVQGEEITANYRQVKNVMDVMEVYD